MGALIARFIANPADDKARARLEAHFRKHPMSVCMLSASEHAALISHNVKLP